MLAAVTQRLARGATRLRASRAFVHCRKGATAVEFALVAAPFIALLVAILQTVLVFFAARTLDEITEEAGRFVLTGQVQTANLNASQFAAQVCTGDTTLTKLVSALFTCAKLVINAQNYSSFSAASTADPLPSFNGYNSQNQPIDSTGNVLTPSWSPGNPGDIVVLQIMYLWPVVGGPLGFSLSNTTGGNRLLMSTVVFKNEPY
jgi:Flp pilus assembly protein TadG